MPRPWRTLASVAAVYACLAADACLASLTGERVETYAQQLQPRSFGDSFEPLEPREPRRGGSKATYQRIRRVPGGYHVEYGFKNFDRAALSVAVRLDEREVAASIREFGFKQREFDALDAWYQEAQRGAIDRARRASFSGKVTAPTQAELRRRLAEVDARNAARQRELDAVLDALAKEYRQRRLELYQKAGFRFKDERVIEVDIPALVRRSVGRLRPMAEAFATIAAERDYEAEDVIGAAAAMVQTSLRYEVPELDDGARVIGGVLPPLKALVLGQGDCDTKSALLASVLKSWPSVRMVGLAIPEHYLLAVHRIPRRGDVFIEHEGIPYVMIESAGPAWLAPGTVGDTTMAYLESGKEFRVQPL